MSEVIGNVTTAAHTGSHVDALLSYRSEPVRIGLFIVVKLTMLTYRDSIRPVKFDNFGRGKLTVAEDYLPFALDLILLS